MNFSAANKACDICLGSIAPGQGQTISSASCSHSFHIGCISNNVRQGNNFCPVCHAKWSNTPFIIPNSNINSNHILRPQTLPTFTRVRQPQFPVVPAFEPEPLIFSDDEPLSANVASSTASASIVGLQKVSIKTSAERPAIAASEYVPEFAVLVGVKAPSLSDDARHSQRAPIDLVTVLDVSGSMFGSKLSLLKRAVHFVIDNLGPSDRLSIVSFADNARRILPLHRMTDNGREQAKRAVDSLCASGSTNIVDALRKGVKVLEERRQHNPVATIIFLSDGNDTSHYSSQNMDVSNLRRAPAYLYLLPASICPRNRGMEDAGQQQTFPVHTFGFGTDHDPLAMHAIADASAGTFSFIEAYEMVQDAFAGCIGGLLSVVTQDLCLTVRSASHGVEIKSIPSGRYASEIANQGSQGILNIGDLYADEEKNFLIYLSVPVLQNNGDDENERKTSLLDIAYSYRDVLSKEIVQIEGDLVEIRRPNSPSPTDMALNLEVDRQRNRLAAVLTISQAQQMAETGNLTGAQALLSSGRLELQATASAQAGDGLCMWLDAEMQETERRMRSKQLYEREGRAYALSGMSSHSCQRATTRGNTVAGAQFGGNLSFGNTVAGAQFGGNSILGNRVAGAQVGGNLNLSLGNTVAGAQFGGNSILGNTVAGAQFGGNLSLGNTMGGAQFGVNLSQSLGTSARAASAALGSFGGQAAPPGAFNAYATPNMAKKVYQSMQLRKKEGVSPMEEY